MNVRMIKTAKGSPDGVKVNVYEEGKLYDVPSSLGCVFVREFWAVEVKVPVAVPEKKTVETIKAEAIAENVSTGSVHRTVGRASNKGRGKESSEDRRHQL